MNYKIIGEDVDTYAQNCEDLILEVLLPKKKGFYVDVGANLPDSNSVTKLFYNKGWRGINIEPIPWLYKHLAEERLDDINLNIGIANKTGMLKLREYEDIPDWSTFSNVVKNLDSRQKHPYKEYNVQVRPLMEIFEENKVKDIDFLKVDVEGFEYQVLISNDWRRWRPTVVVVENSAGKWMGLMKKLGYREVFFDGLNRYFVTSAIQGELILKDYSRKNILLSKKSKRRLFIASLLDKISMRLPIPLLNKLSKFKRWMSRKLKKQK